jgi:hypothetical protein
MKMQFRVLIALIVCKNGTGSGSFSSITNRATKTPALTQRPNGTAMPKNQNNAHGYLGESKDGDYEIVLVSEGMNTPASSHNMVLYPTNVASLRQIVHIRVLWRAMAGTRFDQPTSTNATINWYVRSNMPEAENDKIDYAGAGFVGVYPNKTGANILIRNANLALRDHSGDLVDPLGKPAITGNFNVVRNDGMVRDILASLQTKVASR